MQLRIVDDKFIEFKTLTPEIVLRTIQTSEVIKAGELRSIVRVPWEFKEMQTLAYLGLPYLSPIARDFDFSGPYDPMQHQLLICNLTTMHNRGYCFADMGMGKTAAMIWTASYLASLGLVKKILVVGPKVVMRATWMHEIAMLAPFDSVSILDGTASQRARKLSKDSKWDLINYDGLEVLNSALDTRHYDLIIVDESTMVKNPNTKRWAFLNRITSRTQRVWLLTASPTPQGPMDAFGQIRLLHPETIPADYFKFRSMVMQIGRPSFKTRAGQTVPPEWVPKDEANDILKRFFVPALRLDKRDWAKDLPPVYDMYLEVPLSAAQEKAVKELKVYVAKLVVEDEAVAGGVISKLYQINSGCLYVENETDSKKQVIRYDMQPKVDAVIGLIEEAKARHTGDFIGGKTLIYVSHRHVCEYLTEILSQHYRVGKVIGGTSDRSDTLRSFETTDEYEVIVAVSSAMSHGVTAIAANTMVWFTPATSTEVFIQAGERTDRIGQRQDGRRYYLFSSAAERERHEHLQRGTKTQNEMLSLYKTFLEE